jgi:trehalose 6-phosphate phosphatase
MVYELQPNIDWHKGKAVLHLLEMLDLDTDDVAPLYIGDDITDEDAFRALAGWGIGIIVANPDDPEVVNRTTAADFALESVDAVKQFLDTLAC